MPMPSKKPEQVEEEVKQSFFHTAKAWGENPVVPTGLATLIFAQHARPFQVLPMLFPPALLFSTYMNVNGYKTESAGVTGAWSAAYLAVARRRKHAFVRKFGARGIIRGGTIALCFANVVGCGVAYLFGEKHED